MIEREPPRFMSSTWLHEQAMTTTDAARAVLDVPALAAYLFGAAATFEEMALERVPMGRAITRKIIRDSARALRQKERRVAAGLPPDDAEPTPDPEVFVARGNHRGGYSGVVMQSGRDVRGPCEHRHASTREARDCADLR